MSRCGVHRQQKVPGLLLEVGRDGLALLAESSGQHGFLVGRVDSLPRHDFGASNVVEGLEFSVPFGARQEKIGMRGLEQIVDAIVEIFDLTHESFEAFAPDVAVEELLARTRAIVRVAGEQVVDGKQVEPELGPDLHFLSLLQMSEGEEGLDDHVASAIDG